MSCIGKRKKAESAEAEESLRIQREHLRLAKEDAGKRKRVDARKTFTRGVKFLAIKPRKPKVNADKMFGKATVEKFFGRSTKR